jgi:hypothetical protein
VLVHTYIPSTPEKNTKKLPVPDPDQKKKGRKEKKKCGWGMTQMAQMVEHQPSKCKALSSNSSTAK